MLGRLAEQPADKILSLMQDLAADPRGDKLDLGVGVYRDDAGITPVMGAIKQAELALWEVQKSKSYTGLAGDPAFAAALGDLVLGDAAGRDRRAAIATPGGTGAVRQGLELVGLAAPEATVWVPEPTWPNHLSILAHLGRPHRTYRYYDPATGAVDADGMAADLAGLAKGDVLLLHGCCHNPTGADPDMTLWERIAEILSERGAIPMVDLAYQGFGDGLDADVAGLRHLARQLPEMLIATSCSKNFGLYRERVGLLVALAPDAATARRAQGTLEHLNRQNYSFPPDHGARLVTMVLTDRPLRNAWQQELAHMRDRIRDLRGTLAEELRRQTNSDRFDGLAAQKGMFSRLPATPEQVATMRRDHGIYMVGDGRVNLAGLSTKTVPQLARAMVAAGL